MLSPKPTLPHPLTQLNVAGMKRGSFEALLGEAHQYLVSGILMRLGFQVSMFPVRGGTYDLIVVGFDNPDSRKQVLIRTQVRTLTKQKNLSLLGGRRAGRGMVPLEPYKKGYRYTPEHNDLIIGVDRDNLDLYFVPTKLTLTWGRQAGKARLTPFKNRFDLLLNWNDAFLTQLSQTV